MPKKVAVVLIAAAAVVVGILLWKTMRTAQAAESAAGAPVPPTVAPLPAQLANAFSTLLGSAVNTTAQWFTDKLTGPSRGNLVTEKPEPVNGKGPTVAVPAGSTPNVVTEPRYLA